MTDALGRPRSVLVLGGSSEIALATAELLVERGARSVTLLGRNPQAILTAASPFRARGAEVSALPFDASKPDDSVLAIEEAFRVHGDFDVVLLAFGVLGDQFRYEGDPAAAGRDAAVNFAGALVSGLAVARCLRAQGHGVLVVLSSVAGQRPRRTNFVYGAAKAGVDAFARGLDEALRGSGARVMVVRPGFVRTRMTAQMAEAPSRRRRSRSLRPSLRASTATPPSSGPRPCSAGCSSPCGSCHSASSACSRADRGASRPLGAQIPVARYSMTRVGDPAAQARMSSTASP